jgi:hypothetical protein
MGSQPTLCEGVLVRYNLVTLEWGVLNFENALEWY